MANNRARNANFDRVLIIGCTAAGKSTLARKLSKTLDSTYIELDSLYWSDGWTPVSKDDFTRELKRRIRSDRWVIDGNYSHARDILWPEATLVIWLNYSFLLVFARLLQRTCKRILTNEILYNGNRESLRRSFLSKHSIFWYLIRTYHLRRRQYRTLFDAMPFSNIYKIEVTHPKRCKLIWCMLEKYLKNKYGDLSIT